MKILISNIKALIPWAEGFVQHSKPYAAELGISFQLSADSIPGFLLIGDTPRQTSQLIPEQWTD